MFLNPYRELRWMWGLLLSLIMLFLPSALIGLLFGVVVIIAAGVSQSTDVVALLNSYSGYLNLVGQLLSIGGVLLLFWIVYRRPMREMGFIRKNWCAELLLGCGLGIVSMGLVFGVLLLTGQVVVVSVNWSIAGSPAFLSSLALFILVGFSEEILSRGYMMTAMKTTRKPWAIVLVPSMIFGLLHAANPNVTFFSLVNLVLAGVLFAFLFARTGKLWVPIGYHITWNFFQGNIFGMAVSGTKSVSIIRSRFVGAEWITGGAFGAEGGAVVTAVLVVSIAILWFLVKPPSGDVWSFESGLPLVRWRRGQRPAADPANFG